MIFGKREKKIEIGNFTGEKCNECKDSNTYKFVMIPRYLVVFFMNLLPIGSRYEYVCEKCGAAVASEAKAGSESLEKNFRRKKFRIGLFSFLKIFAIVAVIAAAVILPLTLSNNYGPSPQFIKSLVSKDGTYNITDKKGNNFATVKVSGSEKALTFLDRVSQLVGEPGADGTFYIHQYYQEANDSKGKTALIHPADDSGILSDRYDVPIRYYYYNTSTDTLGYAIGVKDLSAIKYTANKAVYPFSYYTSGSDPQKYSIILFVTDKQRLIATFFPPTSGDKTENQLASLEIQDYDLSGRIAKDTVYYFDDKLMSLAKSSGISESSSSGDLLNFITQNKPDPYATSEDKYYMNTKVISSQTFSMPDSSGKMQTYTQNYDVTEKNGYYIQAAGNNSGS